MVFSRYRPYTHGMTPLAFTGGVFGSLIAAGVLGAVLGLGGGIIVTPVLTIALGIDIRYAICASLVAVIATSSGAAAAYDGPERHVRPMSVPAPVSDTATETVTVHAAELWISNILRVGVWLSLLLVAVGMTVTFVRHPDYRRRLANSDAADTPRATQKARTDSPLAHCSASSARHFASALCVFYAAAVAAGSCMPTSSGICRTRQM